MMKIIRYLQAILYNFFAKYYDNTFFFLSSFEGSSSCPCLTPLQLRRANKRMVGIWSLIGLNSIFIHVEFFCEVCINK